MNLNKASTTKLLMTLPIIALTGLTACSKPSEDKATDSTSKKTGSQSLIIATEGAYAPFNFTNPDGSLGGFDVDIANALCAAMKAECEVVAQDWDGVIPGLQTKKYDAIVAAMSVTPERQEQVDFSEPYFTNSLVFLAKNDSSFDPSKTTDINSTKIGAQRSTISSQWLEKSYPEAEMKLYDTLNNSFMDLGADRIGAMVSDKLPALEWLDSPQAKGFEVKGEDIDIDDNLAIAVRKGDKLKKEFDKALVNIKSNGTYDKIVANHFPQIAEANITVTEKSVETDKKVDTSTNK